MSAPEMHCTICGGRMAGSPLVSPYDPGQVAMITVLHLIDEHWDLVERIRATTGNKKARIELNRQLVSELRPTS